MNKKTLNVYIKSKHATLPITIYEEETQAISPTLRFNTSCSFIVNITGSLVSEDLLENNSFEYPLASGSTIDTWTPEYPYWSRLVSGSYAFGKRFASTNLIMNDTGRSIKSGSFAVSEDTYYDVSFYLKATNGKIFYTNPSTGLSGSEEVLPQYNAYIDWAGSGSEIIYSGSGKTISGNDFTDYISTKYDGLYIPESWNTHRKKVKAPTGCTSASLVFYANFQKPTTYASTYYGNLITSPIVYLDDVYVIPQEQALKVTPELTFDTDVTELFDMVTPSASAVVYSDTYTSGSSDCYGESTTGTFDDDGFNLYAGHSDVNENLYRAWIPFTIDFTSASGGIAIETVTLTVVASKSKGYVPENPCKLSIGFEGTVNPTAPTTETNLFGRTILGTPLNTTISEAWIEGESYTFDLTDSLKSIAGDSGVTWNNGDKIGIIIKDWGSGMGAYQTFAAYENPYYEKPQLTITYKDNFNTSDAYDMTIKNNSPYVDKSIIDVGTKDGYINRGLIKFDVSSIPSGATVTSSVLSLYHSAEFADGVMDFHLYPMQKAWDYYTASWYRQYGTANWSSAGGDYISTSGSVGKLPLNYTGVVNEYKDITITGSVVQDWVNSSANNVGLMIKASTENVSSPSAHRFVSSQSTNEASRPYLTVDYTVGGSPYQAVIKNTEEGSVEEPPTLSRITRLYKDDYVGFFTSGPYIPPGTKRYALLLTETSDGGYYTSIYINNVAITKIADTAGADVRSQAWGLVIPDAWTSGNYPIVKNEYGSVGRFSYFVFSNVNPTTPVLSYAAGYSNSATDWGSAFTLACNAYGAVYDILGLYKSDITPIVSTNQVLLYTRTGLRGTSCYGTPIDGNVTMVWNFQPGARNSQIVVSLNPYGA